MISFTDTAKDKVLGFMEGAENQENLVLRLAISGMGPAGFTYDFFLDERSNIRPTDVVAEEQGLTAVIDAASAKFLQGATIDWKETVEGSGFDVDNPNTPPTRQVAPGPPMEPPPADLPQPDLDNPVAKKVQEIIDTRINPGVASHGGHVQLIDVQEDKVYLKLGGGCQGCGMVSVTLKQGIEVMIKEALPHISQIIDTTDHAGGTNPYYQPGK